MVYPIFTYGEDILRQRAKEVTDFNHSDLHTLISDMYETMYGANGVGLAAPQIGVSKRIIVIEEISEEKSLKGVYINPKILFGIGEDVAMIEGCLSFPGIYETVSRRDAIELEWYDQHGEYHKEFLKGMTARILQHEIDHLDGTLMIDRFRPIDKLLNFNNLEDIKNKKVTPKYSIV